MTDQLRVILAGASNRGNGLGQLIAQTGEARIIACVDPIVTKAEFLVAENHWEGARVYANIEEALAQEACDAVIVASSDPHHAEVVLPALQAGKHVFCEKPLETTREKCRAIIAADRAVGGKTFVGLNLRYAPVYARVKQLIEEGAVGRMLTIQADEFYDGGRTYFRRWNRLRAYGGLWLSKATHDFDIIWWLSGRAMPVEVFATGARSYYAPRADAPLRCRDCQLADCPDRATEITALARLTEEATGTPADLCLFNADGDTFDHGIATIRHEDDILSTYTCNVVAGFTGRRIRVSGTKGTLDAELGGDRIFLYKRDPSDTVEISLADQNAGGHGGADDHLGRQFIAFVRGTGEPRCRPDEAAVSVAVGLAATCSVDEHRMVPYAEYAMAEPVTNRP